MIKNAETLRAFENDLARQELVDYRRNVAIYEALYSEARSLGVLPLKNPLDGIEVDVRLVQVDHGAAMPAHGVGNSSRPHLLV